MYERKPSDAAELHHYEYAFACLGQQWVETTAVSKDISFELAGDAPAATLQAEFPPRQIGKPATSPRVVPPLRVGVNSK